jgi:hypothetical protein
MICEGGTVVVGRFCGRIVRDCIAGSMLAALGVVLFVVCMTANAAAGADDRVGAELDRVAKMSGSQQQAWLQQLERRAARAARLTLPPKEAARQEKQIGSLLHQKKVTWKVLREVIEQTQSREEAIEAAKKVKAVKKANVAKPQAAKVVKARAAKESAQAVTVNVEELEAGIAGANLALRELEADLTEKTAWDAAKLEPLADRLKALVVRHNDLALFRDAVPKEQRAEIAKLEATKSAISQLGARVAEARKRANDPHFVGDDLERRAELTRLDAIAHGLAELAGK